MKSKVILPIFLLGVTASLFSCSSNSSSGHSLLSPSSKEIVLGSADLAKCALSDYSFDGKADSKQFVFKAKDNLSVEGAMLYGDCQYQSAGDDLSKPFVLDNSDNEAANASNFHFLFALKGINYAKFEFDIALDKALLPEMKMMEYQYSVKYTDKFAGGLYEGLKNYHYSDITESPTYDNMFYPWGINDELALTTRNMERHESLEYDPETSNPNVVAFKVNAYSVPAGYTLSVTLTSATIRYSA